jgi:hypothetical protein
VDDEKRRIHLVKQRIGLEHFPSTRAHDAGVVFEGNRAAWAALKRAEETYVAQWPLRKTPQGNVKVGRNVLAEEMVKQSLDEMRAFASELLGDRDAAWEVVSELTRRVESYYANQDNQDRRR